MSDDRRQFQRIEFDTPVLISQNGETLTSEVLDISLKGLLINGSHFPFDLQEPVAICIELSVEVQIEMIAKWAYSRDGVSGFQWLSVDLDSLVHLRRLLEFNCDNPLLLEREISYLSK